MRLRQRALRGEMLVEGVSSLEVIESYPDDKYLPSFLVRGENIRVVTMHVPDGKEWDERLAAR